MANYKTLTYSGAISFSNWLLNSNIISVTNENPRYPAKNLLNPIMSKTYRTTTNYQSGVSSSNSFFQIVFDLGSAQSPTMAAMINSNITKTSGDALYLIGSSSADLSTSTIIYNTLPLYETKTRVLRWYLDTPDVGSGAKRYWGFRFYPALWGEDMVTDSYFEFGNFWLGEYQELRHNYQSRIQQFDKSTKEDSFSGATYVDTNNAGYALTAAMPYVQRASRQSLISNFYTYRKNTHVIVDFEPFIDDVTSSVGGMNCFYGKIDDKIKADFQFSGYTDLQVSFRESIA